jgi:beta-glucanase (GH16 family)
LLAGGCWLAEGVFVGARPADRLDLSKYVLTFSEEFDSLDVSAAGPNTRWTAHTPYGGDFGDAQFADPEAGFPFTIEKGVLRIEARKEVNGKWRSGLLSSLDPQGQGFSQRFGYFEIRAKLPDGTGVWPALWLVGLTDQTVSQRLMCWSITAVPHTSSIQWCARVVQGR